MSENKTEIMDAKRLEEVARFLFPDAGRSWKSKVAKEMKVHRTTVSRWVMNDCVPGGYDLALECIAARKVDLLKQIKNARSGTETH